MRLKIALFLTLPLLLLTACTARPLEMPAEAPRLEVPATLLNCAAMPKHPCPAQPEPAGPPAPVKKRTMFASFFSKEKPVAGTPAAGSVSQPQQCTEKDRLRWEAMVFNWGADCQSKLQAVSGYLKDSSPPARPAPHK